MGRLRKFLALSAQEKSLFVKAVLILPLFRAGMRTIGLKRIQSLMNRSLRAPESPTTEAEVELALSRARSTARIIGIASSHGPVRPTCLERSLALWWLLRRGGIESDLHIGVKPQEEGLEAHAWIEYGGQVLNDSDDVRENFAAFPNPI